MHVCMSVSMFTQACVHVYRIYVLMFRVWGKSYFRLPVCTWPWGTGPAPPSSSRESRSWSVCIWSSPLKWVQFLWCWIGSVNIVLWIYVYPLLDTVVLRRLVPVCIWCARIYTVDVQCGACPSGTRLTHQTVSFPKSNGDLEVRGEHDL